MNEVKSETPTVYEWHNLKTGHCYVDYIQRTDLEQDGEYIKTPLYASPEPQKPRMITLKEASEYVNKTYPDSSYDSQFTTQRSDQRQEIIPSQVESEIELEKYARLSGKDFTLPSDAALGWRCCYNWMVGKIREQGKGIDLREDQRSELIQFLAETTELKLPEGKDCIDIVDEYLSKIKPQ